MQLNWLAWGGGGGLSFFVYGVAHQGLTDVFICLRLSAVHFAIQCRILNVSFGSFEI